MLFFTLDHVYAVDAPSIGDCCFTNQARGPWVIPRHFCRLEPFFAELLTTSLVQTERKTQMLGLELSGLIGEHVIHFHFESFLIVCLPKTARGECVWRGLMKACPQYWHVVVCDCECVSVRVWERERSRGSVWALARTLICTVCLYRCVNDCVCVWEAYCKHAALHSSVRVTIVCMSVCIQYVCVCACLCLSECVFQYMSISFLSQSCYSTFIPLVGLYPVLLCLWI